MIKLFCYLDTQENYQGQIKEYIEQIDSLGHEVYLYSGICASGNQPHDILYSIDSQLKKEESNETLYFLTNISSLFHLFYRLYHQIFESFIYIKTETEESYVLTDEYNYILNGRYLAEEKLFKEVFTNTGTDIITNQNHTYKTVSYLELINTLSVKSNERDNEKESREEVIPKYYLIDNTYYLFEPIISEQKLFITFDQSVLKKPDISNSDLRFKYNYFYNIEKINLLFHQMNDFSANINSIYDTLEDIEEEAKGYFTFVFDMTICILDGLGRLHGDYKIEKTLLLLSFIMQITKKPLYFNKFIKKAIDDKTLPPHSRFFIWNQSKRYSLLNMVSSNHDTISYMKKLYMKAYNEYIELLSTDLSPIPREERDSDTIIVFAIQILGENHAPTRTTLERCHTLLKDLGKNVLLVNTKEQYSLYGGINLYKITEGNVLKEYSKLDVYNYKGVSIPFYQPEEDMPSLSVLSGILKYIRKIKPIMIISIGNGSIVADICGSLVPHVSIGVAFSQLATSNALFSVVGKRLSEDEWLAFEEQGYLRDNIIEGTFTFDLKEKKSEFTREMYQIPEDKFVLVTVGIRLDYEIDETFIETIRRTFEFGTHIVFAGYFDKYYTYCEKYQDFKDNSTYVGYCKDILALMAICDLYVNPIRLGGGFSIIEAFHEGKPGVTVNIGDIAAASGDEFTVSNYDEMIEEIRRYVYDQEYYDLMVIKARERERVVTDSSYAMGQILSKVSNNRLFF